MSGVATVINVVISILSSTVGCARSICEQTDLCESFLYLFSGLKQIRRALCSNFKSLASFLHHKLRPFCSPGSHYVEITNAVPLFSSQRKQGIPQIPILLETWCFPTPKLLLQKAIWFLLCWFHILEPNSTYSPVLQGFTVVQN